MNKPAAIILAVAGYCITETILLFSLIAFHPLYNPTPYQLTVGFGQILIIPGMAALMSRVMYGRHQSLRRTLAILRNGIAAVPIGLVSILLPAWFLALLFDVSRALFAVAFPVVTLAVVTGWVFVARKAGIWAVKAEAERWLVERQAGTCQRDRIRRNCSIRFAVFIPTLLVLPIFLFLPETWGIFTHLAQSDAKSLPGYRVTIPATWIIVSHQISSDGNSWVYGIAGKGVGRGVNPLSYDSLASWDVRTWRVGNDTFNQRLGKNYKPPEGSDILARRDLTVGGDPMTCVDYWLTQRYGANGSKQIAHVTCAGRGPLSASFDGRRSQLPAFYDMLTTIKPR